MRLRGLMVAGAAALCLFAACSREPVVTEWTETTVQQNVVTLSGTMSGGYDSAWIPCAGDITRGANYDVTETGTFGANGAYRIQVPENRGYTTVFAFLDGNGNGIYDEFEMQSDEKIDVEVGTDDLTGLDFYAPATEMLTISCHYTTNYVAGWIPYLSVQNLVTYQYGTVDANGNSEFKVPQNWNTFQFSEISIYSFFDANGNGVKENDEYDYIRNSIDFQIEDTNMSIDLTLPELSYRNVTVELKGNVYGVPMGVMVMNITYDAMDYSAVSSDENITATVTVPCDPTPGENNGYSIYYYFDVNENGKYDGKLIDGHLEIMENQFKIDYIITNEDFSLSTVLTPKAIVGTVDGSGKDNYQSVYIENTKAVFSAPIEVDGSYALRFYSVTNFPSTFTFMYDEYCLSVNEFDELFYSYNVDPMKIDYTNLSMYFSNDTVPYTNTRNWTVDVCNVHHVFTGLDNYDDILMGQYMKYKLDDLTMRYTYYPANSVSKIYRFGDDDITYEYSIFRDINQDGLVYGNIFLGDKYEPILGEPCITISNQTDVTNEVIFQKAEITFDIDGETDSYTNPVLAFKYLSDEDYIPTILECVDQTYTAYSTDGVAIKPDVIVFDDVNGNGYQDDDEDSIYEKNSIWSGTYIAATNLIIPVTNK